jgi:hypothetical protein
MDKSSGGESLSAALRASSGHRDRPRDNPMEAAVQPKHVRRHPDGSIDYDFYHRRAADVAAAASGDTLTAN